MMLVCSSRSEGAGGASCLQARVTV